MKSNFYQKICVKVWRDNYHYVRIICFTYYALLRRRRYYATPGTNIPFNMFKMCFDV